MTQHGRPTRELLADVLERQVAVNAAVGDAIAALSSVEDASAAYVAQLAEQLETLTVRVAALERRTDEGLASLLRVLNDRTAHLERRTDEGLASLLRVLNDRTAHLV